MTINKTIRNEIVPVVIDTEFDGSWAESKKVPTARKLYAKINTLGTVSSVGVTMPGIFSVSGSPVTSSGTIAVSLQNQTGNTVFASPSNGSLGTPSFRALVASDFPNLDASKITTGQFATARMIATSGNHQVAFLNGSQVLTSSNRMLFDGTDLSLVNPTAASAGTQTQNSPALYLKGTKWRTDASVSEVQQARVRIIPQRAQYNHVLSAKTVFETWNTAGSGWMETFSFEATDADYLMARYKFGNPVNSGWGGYLDVNYNGEFNFKTLAGVKSQLSGLSFGKGSGLGYEQFFPNNYDAEIRTHFGGRILLSAGRPSWFYGDNAGNTGNEYVQTDLRFGIGTTSLPSARLHIIGTTEQFRFGYNTSNYGFISVGNSGIVTFNAVGASAKFVFQKAVEVPTESFSSAWNGKQETPTKNDLFNKFSATWGDLSNQETVSSDGNITKQFTIADSPATLNLNLLPPAASGLYVYTIYNNNLGLVNIDSDGAEPINGMTTYSIGYRQTVTVVWNHDADQWHVIAIG